MLDPALTPFLSEHLKGLGLAGSVIAVGFAALQIYMTARRAQPAASYRDVSHDEIMGTLRNIQTTIEALGRRADSTLARHEQMHADGERDREAIKRDLAMLVALNQSARIIHHTER